MVSMASEKAPHPCSTQYVRIHVLIQREINRAEPPPHRWDPASVDQIILHTMGEGYVTPSFLSWPPLLRIETESWGIARLFDRNVLEQRYGQQTTIARAGKLAEGVARLMSSAYQRRSQETPQLPQL